MEKLPLFDTSVKVTWYQWEKKLMAFHNDLTLMVPSFLQDFFIKQKQSDSYMKLKEQVETMTAQQLLCRLTLLKIIPLFGKLKFSQLTGTKTKSLLLLLPFGKVWVVPWQWLRQTIRVILGTVLLCFLGISLNSYSMKT